MVLGKKSWQEQISNPGHIGQEATVLPLDPHHDGKSELRWFLMPTIKVSFHRFHVWLRKFSLNWSKCLLAAFLTGGSEQLLLLRLKSGIKAFAQFFQLEWLCMTAPAGKFVIHYRFKVMQKIYEEHSKVQNFSNAVILLIWWEIFKLFSLFF